MESTETSLGADTTSNHYIIDIESGAETARLIEQEYLFTQAMGGLFPEQLDLAHVKRILDIGCGPGAWVNDVISGKGKPDTEGAAFAGCTLGDDATAKLLH